MLKGYTTYILTSLFVLYVLSRRELEAVDLKKFAKQNNLLFEDVSKDLTFGV